MKTVTPLYKIKDFFSQEKFKNTSVIEIGTERGEITKILAELFENVFTITTDFEALEESMEGLQQYGNIHCAPFDVYTPDELKIPGVGISAAVLNSADTYEKTISDLNRMIADPNKNIRYVVVTKYGLPEVEKAAMEAINNNPSIEKISYEGLMILYIDRLRGI